MKKRDAGWNYFAAVLYIFFIFFQRSSYAETYVNRINGTVKPVSLMNEVWTKANSPYIIEADVTVEDSGSLVIEAGSVIKFGGNCGLFIYGGLFATNVLFQQLNTNTNWAGIYLNVGQNQAVLQGCGIYNAGGRRLANIFNGVSMQGAVCIDSCSPLIKNCTITNSWGNGIELFESSAQIIDCSITGPGLGFWSICVSSSGAFPVLSNNTAIGSTNNFVYVNFGEISGSITMNKPGPSLDYVVDGDVNVASGATLEVEAGTHILNNGTRYLIDGTLKVHGLTEAPVIFKSLYDTPRPGSWYGFHFRESSGRSVITNCVIADAGMDSISFVDDAWRQTAVLIERSNPMFENVTIKNSAGDGLTLINADPEISNLTIVDCLNHGLTAENNCNPRLRSVSFINNGETGKYVVSIDTSFYGSPENLSFSNNLMNAVEIRGGNFDKDKIILKNWADNVPFMVSQNCTVNEGVVLKILPQSVLKFNNAGLFIYGSIDADGVVFTSYSDDEICGDSNGDGNKQLFAGDWKGLYFGSSASNAVLKNCKIRYAGSTNFLSEFGITNSPAIYIDRSSPVLSNCVVSEFTSSGIELRKSRAVIVNTVISNINAGCFGMVFDDLECFPMLSNNNFSGVGFTAIKVPDGVIAECGKWTSPGPNIPYICNGVLTISQDAVLGLDPGVILYFQKIDIYGQLRALGTDSNLIKLSAVLSQDDPEAWSGIAFNRGASTNSLLSYCVIENAGQVVGSDPDLIRNRSAVLIDSVDIMIDHVTITNSYSNGIILTNSNSRITDSVITGCRQSAVVIKGAKKPTLINNIFRNNGQDGAFVVVISGSTIPENSGNVFQDNRMQAVVLEGFVSRGYNFLSNWAANTPYVILGSFSVQKNSTLEIFPGTVLKLKDIEVDIFGTVTARGNESNKIVFTSIKDDSVLGDSNGDGVSVPASGDWLGILFAPSSGNSVLEHCIVKYAGGKPMSSVTGDNKTSAILIEGSSPTIRNCEIVNCKGNGIQTFASGSWIESISFINVTEWPVYVGDLSCVPYLSGLSNQNNLSGLIRVRGGVVNTNLLLKNPGFNFSYYVDSDIVINDSATMSIEPGVAVRMKSSGIYVYGALIAIGSSEQPVIFTTDESDAKPGSWIGVYFMKSQRKSVLNNCSILYAGGLSSVYLEGANRQTALFVNESSPVLQNLKILNSNDAGLEIWNSGVVLVNSVIAKNSGHGVFVFKGNGSRIYNCTIVGNGKTGLAINQGTVSFVNNIIVSNGLYGVSKSNSFITNHHNCYFKNSYGNYDLQPASSDVNADPKLNGSDFSLMQGSPVIDRGDNSINILDVDISGKKRVQGDSVDMGAYEWGTDVQVGFVDLMIKASDDSEYVGESTKDLAIQTKSTSVALGSKAVFYAKIKNDCANATGAMFISDRVPAGWHLSIYPLGGVETNVLGGDLFISQYIDKIAPGQTREFRLEFQPDASVRPWEVLSLQLSAFSLDYVSNADVALIQITNMPAAGVDLSIRRSGTADYRGKGVINTNSFNQTIVSEVSPGSKLEFEFELVNCGNVADTITLSADSQLFDNSFISFYEVGDVTNEVKELANASGLTIRLDAGGKKTYIASLVIGPVSSSKLDWGVIIKANSGIDSSKMDIVKYVVLIKSLQSRPLGKVYTSDADFDAGVLDGVDHTAEHDQLQLSGKKTTYPYIWVPNSNEGSVSKIDVFTGKEVGRYLTGPNTLGSPSRTTVDFDGSCWIGNRVLGTVVKIGLPESGMCYDRNGNGVIDTSTDVNGNGIIDQDEILPWGKDECVLWEVVLSTDNESTWRPGEYGGSYTTDIQACGPRGLTVDRNGDVWVGTFGSMRFYKLDRVSAKVLKVVDLTSYQHTCYGLVSDRRGILWSSGHSKNNVLRYDPVSGEVRVIDVGHFVYGIGLGVNDQILVTGWTDSKITCIDAVSGKVLWTVQGIYQSRGITTTPDGDIWTANSGPGSVARWSTFGQLKSVFNVGHEPTGVSVDANGKIWVVNNGDGYVKRIDPERNVIDLEKILPGTYHYGYSDMTGFVAKNYTVREGSWTIIHDSQYALTSWGTVSWNCFIPEGGKLEVLARSSFDKTVWSDWEVVSNAVELKSTPMGRFLQVKVFMSSNPAGQSPILYDLTISPANQMASCETVYYTDFNSIPGNEWSDTTISGTPSGNKMFLGPFGNNTVNLALYGLPEHDYIKLSFDLFVIGDWCGNSYENGPDLFSVEVDGGVRLLYTTFNNGSVESKDFGQSYPGNYPANYPALFGAVCTNCLGFERDAVYHLNFYIRHNSDSIQFNFIGSGIDGFNECWGLANVRVDYVSSGHGLISLAIIQNNNLPKLKLYGEPGRNYIIEMSSDLVNWQNFSTNMLTEPSLEIDVPDISVNPVFFRAKLVE